MEVVRWNTFSNSVKPVLSIPEVKLFNIEEYIEELVKQNTEYKNMIENLMKNIKEQDFIIRKLIEQIEEKDTIIANMSNIKHKQDNIYDSNNKYNLYT